jgi:UDP-N-acetylglucosamine 2-epimerase (non-hydrolysing)
VKIPAKVIHVVGARPNFMKIAPIMEEVAKYTERFEQVLVHTGQHYDDAVSSGLHDETKI